MSRTEAESGLDSNVTVPGKRQKEEGNTRAEANARHCQAKPPGLRVKAKTLPGRLITVVILVAKSELRREPGKACVPR
jgi:hypothetical protein